MSWQKRKYRDQLKGYTDLLPRNLPTYLPMLQSIYTRAELGKDRKLGIRTQASHANVGREREREGEKDRETEDGGAFSESVPTLLDGSETG